MKRREPKVSDAPSAIPTADDLYEDETENPTPLAPRAHDALPVEAIRLSDAFTRVHEAAKQNPHVLQCIPEWAEDNLWCTIETLKEEEKSWEPEDRTSEVHIKAACLFRIALHEELAAYVRDPVHNVVLKLNPEEWFFCDERVPTKFEDWLSHSETPGPEKGTIIHGVRRPVYLLISEFETWLSDRFKLGLKPRKKRAGSFEIADAPLVEKMHVAILSGDAKSAKEAASKYVESARGGGTRESKETRLRRAYYEKYRE